MAVGKGIGIAKGWCSGLAAAQIVTGVVSGTLAAATIGSPYDSSLTVTPPGSAVTLDPATAALIAAHNITHDGFGRFTSPSVT